MTLFVDTSAFVALADHDDAHSPAARDFFADLKPAQVRLHTTNFILGEAVTWIRARLGHREAMKFHHEFFGSGSVSVFTVEPVTESEAWRIFSEYDDKTFSYVDCASFAVMRAMRIRMAFTFDKHFAQFGFETVP